MIQTSYTIEHKKFELTLKLILFLQFLSFNFISLMYQPYFHFKDTYDHWFAVELKHWEFSTWPEVTLTDVTFREGCVTCLASVEAIIACPSPSCYYYYRAASSSLCSPTSQEDLLFKTFVLHFIFQCQNARLIHRKNMIRSCVQLYSERVNSYM